MDFGYLNQGLELAAPLPTRCPSGRPIDICMSLKPPKNMWDIIFNHNSELGSYNSAVLPVVAVAVAVYFGKKPKKLKRGITAGLFFQYFLIFHSRLRRSTASVAVLVGA